MDIYNLANIIIPCITLGVSLFTPGVSVSCDRMFRCLMLFTVIAELMGAILQDFLQISNFIVYNIYMLVLFPGYFYMYFLLNKKTNKRMFLYGGILFLVWLTEWVSFQTLNETPFFFAYSIGSLFLLYIVYVYITNRLNSPAVENIEKSRYFWISIGVLVFYILFLPAFLGVKYALIDSMVLRGILLLLQILMHTSFIVGIRWGNRI